MLNLSHGNTAATLMDPEFGSTTAFAGRRLKVIGEHLYSDLRGEAVVLNLTNGNYYGLNAVGRSIWKVLQSPVTTEEIECSLLHDFDVDQETCRREVSAFLLKMLNEKLVEFIDD